MRRVIPRGTIAALFGAVLAGVAAHIVLAQAGYPAGVVKIIVPFPAGGLNDVLARIVGNKLQAKWGQPFIIENKTGAGGNIGAEAAYQAAADGYTLLVSPPGPLAINQSLYPQLSFRPEEFVPMTVIGSVPNLVIVRKDLPVNSLKELIQYIKANPGKVTFGSQGNGSTPHLTGMMFQMMIGGQLIHVPYRGENLVLNDLVGEHVDLFFGNIAAAIPFYRDGKVKLLAIADTSRAPGLPDIPTTAVVGLPGLVSTSWFALAGPPKFPPALQVQIADAVTEILKMSDVAVKLRAISVTPGGQSPTETVSFIKDEAQPWGAVIKNNNIVVE